MSNLIQQNWSVTIQALQINQGTKFGTLKKPMFSLFDGITFLFKWIIKQNFRTRLPVSNIWNNRLSRIIAFPRIIAPFDAKNKYTPGLLFEEIRYVTKIREIWTVLLFCFVFCFVCLFVYVFVLDVDSRTSHNLVFHFVSKEWNENLPRGSRSRCNNSKLRYCSKLS